jgi:uncharacterized protein (TIGR02145 family)
MKPYLLLSFYLFLFFSIVNCNKKNPTEASTTTVTDIDGFVYKTVKIGNQWWMAENLKVTRYRNGDYIPHVTDNSTWEGLTTGACCNFNNDGTNATTYGSLYNWYAVNDSRNIAPAGWHVPSDEEWKELEMYLGMSQSEADNTGWRGTDEGGKLKDAGTGYWIAPNTGATNESGFSALPGGCRHCDGLYYEDDINHYAEFWTSTEYNNTSAFLRTLSWRHSTITRTAGDKQWGFSVRCVKD